MIDFHKRATPMGPPAAHRLGREEAAAEMREAGFEPLEAFNLGENFYCLLFVSR